jgi:hypothetical protein
MLPPNGTPHHIDQMPTVRCACGEQLHYSADKAGLIARCRCGRPVRLPEPRPEPVPLSREELYEQERRARNVRNQILAVALFVVLTIAFVVYIAFVNNTPPRPRQPYNPTPIDG